MTGIYPIFLFGLVSDKNIPTGLSSNQMKTFYSAVFRRWTVLHCWKKFSSSHGEYTQYTTNFTTTCWMSGKSMEIS